MNIKFDVIINYSVGFIELLGNIFLISVSMISGPVWSWRVRHVLAENTEGILYLYAPDFVIGSSVLCLNITQINQMNAM